MFSIVFQSLGNQLKKITLQYAVFGSAVFSSAADDLDQVRVHSLHYEQQSHLNL